MSDTTDSIVLRALHTRKRDLELEAVAVKAMVEEVDRCIALIARGGARRSGRPRSSPIQVFGMASVTNRPVAVAGGLVVAEPEPQDAA